MGRYSISFWMISRNIQTEGAVIFEGDPTSYKDLYLSTLYNTFKFRCDKESSPGITKFATFPVDSSWVHVVAVCKPALVTLYINGQQVQSETGSFAFRGYHYPFQIGRAADGVYNGLYFKGVIDDVRIYKTDLGPDDVDKLYKEKATATKQTLAAAFTIYPNPAQNLITISGATSAAHLIIRNSIGQVVHQQKADAGDTYVDIATWPTGIYSVVADNKKGSTTRTFVKQ